MNYKVKFKMIRNLINSVFITGEKSELVDLLIDDNLTNDDDILSVLKIINFTEQKNALSIDDVVYIYNNILPSIEKQNLDNISNFYKYYSKNINNITKISKYILQYDIFNKFSFVIMIILVNHIYFLKHKKYLVFFTPVKESLTKLSKKTYKEYDEAYKLIEELNLEYYIKFNVLELDVVIELIKNLSTDLLEFYNVSHIYIFGSYAKGKQTEYSDLDILLELNDATKKNLYVTGNTFSFEIKELTGIRSDVHVKLINDKPTDFERNILKHAIKIK